MSAFDKVTSIDKARRKAKARAQSLQELFEEDLARSGIPLKVAKLLGFELMDAQESWARIHPKRADDRPSSWTAEGYWMPYFGRDGQQINFGRFRKLRGSFGKKDTGKNKYRTIKNSLPHLYVPWPLLTWQSDPVQKIAPEELCVTEGEKKAIKACLCGIPTVALGGCNMFESAKHRITLLPEFDWFNLAKTDVRICFDSDAYENPNVNTAMYSTAYTVRREKHPELLRYVRLTSESDAKTGLDDFLAGFDSSERARKAFDRLTVEPDRQAEAYAKFNSEIAQVRKKQCFYNIATGTFYRSKQKVEEEYGAGSAVPTADGKKLIQPIQPWFSERPPETTVIDVVYEPGKPERFRAVAGHEQDTLNMWRPSALEPTPYSAKNAAQLAPYLNFIEYLTPKLTDGQRDTLLDWFAYPLKNLGAKMDFAVLLKSTAHGTGKNTAARILKPMYGDGNWYELKGSSLASKFNNWARYQFLIINEVRVPSQHDRIAVMDDLKTIITEPMLDVEEKFMPRENVPNHVNLFLTSNKDDALPLETDDRRFFVIQCPEERAKWSKKKFEEFNRWLDNGGVERVFGFLLARDLRDFSPHMDAPRTDARRKMIQSTNSPLDDLVEMLRTTPLKLLGVQRSGADYMKPDADLFLPSQIIEAFSGYAAAHNMRLNLSVHTLGAAMKKPSEPFPRKELRITVDGRKKEVVAYAIFNIDEWRSAGKKKWRDHVKEHHEEILR